MTISNPDVSIEVYLGADAAYDEQRDPDTIIGGEDIKSVDLSARVGEVMDEFTLVLHNHGGKYTETYPLQAADRLVFIAERNGSVVNEWTGRIQTVNTSRQTLDIAEVEVTGVDYAGDIISDRLITRTYQDKDVGDIIVDILESKAKEVDPTAIGQLGTTTDVNYSSIDCWDVIQRLAARADAVIIPDGQGLLVEDLYSLPYEFEVDTGDFYGPPSLSVDDDVKNVVRVDGGVDRKLEAEQTTVDSFVRVNDSNRVTHQVRARKSEIHSFEIYAEQVEAEDNLRVRFQADEGGSPVDPTDDDSDIASASWEGDNVPLSGWLYFNIPDHTLPDRDPWVIVESEGPTGHDVGVDANGNLAYKSYYPFPINYEVQSTDSIEEYGHRELQVKRNNIKTLVGARDAGKAELARRAFPTKSVEFEAESLRAHQLDPGDRIDINRPQDGISGEFVVTEVDTTWDSATVQLQTSITAEWRKGILADVS